MEQYADQFKGILSEYISTYQALITLSKEKTQILVAGDISRLDDLLARETEILLTAKKLELKRNKLLVEWGQDEKWASDNVTLEFVISQLVPQFKTETENQAVQLKRLIEELRGINQTNGELIEQSLQFVNYTLELMTGSDAAGMTYGADGHMGGKQAFKVFDQKA